MRSTRLAAGSPACYASGCPYERPAGSSSSREPATGRRGACTALGDALVDRSLEHGGPRRGATDYSSRSRRQRAGRREPPPQVHLRKRHAIPRCSPCHLRWRSTCRFGCLPRSARLKTLSFGPGGDGRLRPASVRRARRTRPSARGRGTRGASWSGCQESVPCTEMPVERWQRVQAALVFSASARTSVALAAAAETAAAADADS